MKQPVFSQSHFGAILLTALVGAITPAISPAQNAGGAPALSQRTFKDPPASVRPIYRWWLPLASVDPTELRRELDQMVKAGAGGVEVAAMPVPGPVGRDATFLGGHGFGTTAWSQALETIFDPARRRRLRVDLMVGPSWPTTVPSVSRLDDPAAQQKLVAGYIRIEPGKPFAGPLPLPAKSDEATTSRTLIAVLAARCETDECPEKGGTRSVDPSSVRDLTKLADAGGKLTWVAPPGAAPWWVIALYQTADGQKLEHLSASTPNYVVDHIGPAGARAVTDFYDDVVLTPRLRSLIRGADGSSLFEDSFEPSDGLKWTSTFMTEFERRRGYSLKPYLPLMVGGGVGARKGFFEYAGIGDRVREDYRQTFSDLYGDNHIKPYNRWAHGVGMTTRLQVEGGAMEVSDLAGLPDIPEGENRNFLNNPELWKVIGAGAQLRKLEAPLSTECCPVAGGTWATTAGGKPFTVAQGTGAPFGQAGNDANLNWVYKAYAGGVNQLVWHGFPYLETPEGSGQRSRWPGNTFDGNTQFSEAFGPRMPQWQDYRLVNDHLARLQLALRQGRPRYDVAVFWHDFGVKGLAPNVTAFTGYPGLSKMLETTSPLARAGYTYQYVGPSNLTAEAERDVRDNQWMPDRMGFRAILLNDQAVMPVESLRRIRDVVRLGNVPLVVIGRAPMRTPGLMGMRGADSELARIVTELKTLARQPGSRIRFVTDEAGAAEALAAFGVRPAAMPVMNGSTSDILTVRRRSDDTDYYLLFNQGVRSVETTLSLTGSGMPFELDTWTGEVEPIGLYEQAGAAVRIPVTLAPNDVKLIAVGRPTGMRAVTSSHATSTTGGTVRHDDGGLVLRVDRAGTFSTRLSDGRTIESVAARLSAPIHLDRWALAIESWTSDGTGLPGLDHTQRQRLPAVAVQGEANHALPGWAALGYPDKAGLGHYSTEVVLSPSWKRSDGAWLDLGLVVDTFRVTVNGTTVASSSYQDTSRIDIGRYLHGGTNRIEVRVATPLRNAVESATKEGAKLLPSTGLIGPAVLRFYRDLPLKNVASMPLKKD